MDFFEKIDKVMRESDSLLCVGLDPDVEKIPDAIAALAKDDLAKALFEFNKAIIDSTHDLVCCYKPNSAFYEAYGALGIEALKKTCDYIRDTHPSIPIMLDAKRGDIGNTNKGYARFAFEYLGVDALTAHPYQGIGALTPFLEYKDRGIVVLCHTSNPEAKEFQELSVDGEPLYKRVAKKCKELYEKNKNVAIVTGATFPQELKELREMVEDMLLLVPGIGAQGADVKAAVGAGLSGEGRGMIINSSRGILYASSNENFAGAARAAATKLRDEINMYR